MMQAATCHDKIGVVFLFQWAKDEDEMLWEWMELNMTAQKKEKKKKKMMMMMMTTVFEVSNLD